MRFVGASGAAFLAAAFAASQASLSFPDAEDGLCLMVGLFAGAAALDLVLGAFSYFLPAWIAQAKNRRDADFILALNMLLGWTMIGWLAALVWALARHPVRSTIADQASTDSLPSGPWA
jgi:hypothetical protein